MVHRLAIISWRRIQFQRPEWRGFGRERQYYVADTGNNAVERLYLDCFVSNCYSGGTTLSGSCQYSFQDCISTIGGGFSDPQAMAIENGFVYVADTGNSLVKRMPAGENNFNPACTSASCVTTLGGESNLTGSRQTRSRISTLPRAAARQLSRFRQV